MKGPKQTLFVLPVPNGRVFRNPGIGKAAGGFLSDTEKEDWLGGLLGARVRIGCSAHWDTLTGIRIVRIALGSDRRQESCETCDLPEPAGRAEVCCFSSNHTGCDRLR